MRFDASILKIKAKVCLISFVKVVVVVCLIDGFLDIVIPLLLAAKNQVVVKNNINQGPNGFISGLQRDGDVWRNLKVRSAPGIKTIFTEIHSAELNIFPDGRRSNGMPEPKNPVASGYLLGSSVAFGYGVEDSNTLAAHLERRLQNVHIKNYASMAQPISESVLRWYDLKSHGAKPDFVIIAGAVYTLYADCTAPPNKKPDSAINIFHFLYGKIKSYANNYAPDGDDVGRKVLNMCTSKSDVELALFNSLNSIENAIAFGRKENVPFYIVYLPTPYGVGVNVENLKKDKYFHERLKNYQDLYLEYHKRLSKINAPEFIDLSRALPQDKAYFLDMGGHLSDEGNRIIADKIFDYISRDALNKSASGPLARRPERKTGDISGG